MNLDDSVDGIDFNYNNEKIEDEAFNEKKYFNFHKCYFKGNI